MICTEDTMRRVVAASKGSLFLHQGMHCVHEVAARRLAGSQTCGVLCMKLLAGRRAGWAGQGTLGSTVLSILSSPVGAL